MTTENMENLDGQDVIGQEQQGLDAEQGIQAAVQPLTEEAIRQIVQQQTDQIQRQIASHQASALDANRRDWTADMDRRFVEERAGRGREQLLASLDEEERERTQAVFTVMDAERQAREPNTASAPPPAPPQADPMEAAYRYVEKLGLRRNNPSINYSILTNPALADREGDFTKNVSDEVVRQALATAAQPAPAQAAQPANPVQHPPIDGGQGMSTQSQAEEDIEADFISDKINETVYRERMAPFRAV